jgi:hypothetical protein
MRWAGRCVFVLFLAWLLAVVLGGLGLTPVVGIPFAHVLRPSQGPPPLGRVQPTQPAAADLRPAVPAAVFAARAARSGRSATAPGQTKLHPSPGLSHGRSAVAPGQTKTSPSSAVPHGGSASAPGQTKTNPSSGTLHGGSTSAPGQTKRVSTLPTKKP